MRTAFVALALLPLLLAPLVAGAPTDGTGTFLEAGLLHGEGPANAMQVWGANQTRFQLQAQELRTETLTQSYGPGVLGQSRSNHTDSTTYDQHRNVQLDGWMFEDTSMLFLTGHPRVLAANIDLSDVVVAPASHAIESARVTPPGAYEGWSYPVLGLMQFDAEEGVLQFQGDFTVRLWAANLAGEDAQGAVSYEGGTFVDEVQPGGLVHTGKREVYHTLFVTNGSLTVQVPSTAAVRAFMAGPTLISGTEAVLYDARGVYKNLLLDGSNLDLAGFSLLADVDHDQLRLQDMSPEPAATIISLPSAKTSYALGLPLLVLVAAGLVLWLRSRRQVSIPTLLQGMDAHAYRRVVRQADGAMKRTRSESVAVMKTVALLALGRSAVALRYLEDLPDDVRPKDGMAEFLRAHALNELDREDEARVSLRDALGENPSLVVELSRFPRLRALVPSPDDTSAGVYA